MGNRVVFVWQQQDGSQVCCDNLESYGRLVNEFGRLPDLVQCEAWLPGLHLIAFYQGRNSRQSGDIW